MAGWAVPVSAILSNICGIVYCIVLILKCLQVGGGMGLFALELNVKLKVVTVELCLDGEHRAASVQLEKKTLVAQMHDTSLKLVHYT